MKIFQILLAAVLAQDGPGDNSARAMSLDKKIDNAQVKCGYYMNKAMVCHPPSGKIGKYTYRFNKVLLDAKHHLQVGKCSDDAVYGGGAGYRKRRETDEELEAEFAQLVSEMNDGFTGKNQYGNMASPNQLNKLEGLCRKFVNAALNDDSLSDCGKLGAWQNRATQLLDDLVAMKNVCLKQAAAAEAEGNDPYAPTSGGGNNNNNNNNNNYGGGNNNKPNK